MNRKSLIASLGLVAGVAAAFSAQAPPSNGKADQKTIQSIRVTVIGCVAGGTCGTRTDLRSEGCAPTGPLSSALSI